MGMLVLQALVVIKRVQEAMANMKNNGTKKIMAIRVAIVATWFMQPMHLSPPSCETIREAKFCGDVLHVGRRPSSPTLTNPLAGRRQKISRLEVVCTVSLGNPNLGIRSCAGPCLCFVAAKLASERLHGAPGLPRGGAEKRMAVN